ncbi:MAG: competence/damage-inducible protein A [Acidobacteria bacterium]|nr:MAG: competence/damage-inducible protein A [Acidobacteriota bacterium]
MQVEIVSVGTELLLGDIVDTNSAWLGRELTSAGIDICHQTTVGDNLPRIRQTLEQALARADAVIVTGGLGPTPDDITREAIADVMGVGLVRNSEIERLIASIFRSRDRSMPESNMRQADVPAGARWIEQRLGTAPGLICPLADRVIYALPGVPHEMEEMFTRAVLPDLRERSGQTGVIVSRVIKTWGASESAVADMIAERVEQQGNPTIAFLAGGGEIKVRLTAKAPSREEAMALIADEERAVTELLKNYAFGTDGETLAYALGREVREKGIHLAVAESLTGGMVGSAIVDVPGASDWFLGSAVVYTNHAKTSLLGIDPGLLETHGAVSAECARAMAEGARRIFGADVALSCTGEAGPHPLEAEIGQVYFAVSTQSDTRSIGIRLPGDRERIRLYSTSTLLDFARRTIASD